MAKRTKKRRRSSSRHSTDDLDIDKLFEDGTPSTGFNNLPEGTYEGHVKAGSARIEKKESSGHRALMTLVVDSDDDLDGREQTARYDLTTQVGVDIFLGELETMELGQPDSLQKAGDMLEESDDVPVRFWVGPQQEEFPPKVRINERLEGNGGKKSKKKSKKKADEEVAPDNTSDYTRKEINKMLDDELDDVADELGLDPDDYETYPKLAKAIIEELSL